MKAEAQPLTAAEIARLEQFAGYGNPAGKLWFIGIEEGGEGEDNLRRRLQFNAIEDNLRAHDLLGFPKFHTKSRVIQPTWRGMCILALALAGKNVDRESIREYQAEHLGREGDDTFLTELYPLPKRRIGRWPYAHLIPHYPSEGIYRAQLKAPRIALLRKLLSDHPCEKRLLVAYGKTCWPEFREIFPERKFESRGAFEASALQGADTIILAPHFTAREMNAGIHDLIALARALTA